MNTKQMLLIVLLSDSLRILSVPLQNMEGYIPIVDSDTENQLETIFNRIKQQSPYPFSYTLPIDIEITQLYHSATDNNLYIQSLNSIAQRLDDGSIEYLVDNSQDAFMQIAEVLFSYEGKYCIIRFTNRIVQIYKVSKWAAPSKNFTLNGIFEAGQLAVFNDQNRLVIYTQTDLLNFDLGQSEVPQTPTYTLNENFLSLIVNWDMSYAFGTSREITIIIVQNLETQQVYHLRGHEKMVKKLYYLRRSDQLLSRSADGMIKIWDYQQKTCLHTYVFKGSIQDIQIPIEENYLLCHIRHGEGSAIYDEIHVLDLYEMTRISKFKPTVDGNPVDTLIKCMSVHPELEYIVGKVYDELYVWSFREQMPKANPYFKMNDLDLASEANTILKMPGKLIVGTNTGQVMAVTSNMEIQWSIQAHNDFVNDIVYIPPLDAIISISDDQTIIAWNKVDYVRMYQMQTKNPVISVDGSKDGCFLIALCKLSHNATLNPNSSEIYLYDIFDIDEKLHVPLRRTFIAHDKGGGQVTWLGYTPRFASCGYDKTIKIWHTFDESYCKVLIGHEAEIRVCTSTSDGRFIISGSDDRTVRIWNTQNQKMEGVLKGHTDWILQAQLTDDENYIISGGRDHTIIIWSFIERIAVCQIDIDFEVTQLAVSLAGNYIYMLDGNGQVYRVYNPILSRKAIVYPDQPDGFFFRNYCIRLLRDEKVPYKEEYNKFIIMPYKINILHFLAYKLRETELVQALKTNTKWIISDSKDTALSLALFRKNHRILECLVKRIPKYILPHFPYAALSIEEYIPQLNYTSVTSLDRLYNALIVIGEDKNLPGFGVPLKSPPMIKVTENYQIDHTNFIMPLDKDGEFQGQPIAVQFLHSLCRFYLEPGSLNSIEFLTSLLECKNSEVFRAPMIKFITYLKWQRLVYAIIGQSVLYLIFLACLSFYTLQDYGFNQLVMLIPLVVLNSLFLLFELLQMRNGFVQYISDLWNVQDSLRIIALYIYFIFDQLKFDNEYMNWVFVILTMSSWIRAISYFRIFGKTRYLIRMIKEVVKDMLSFLLILMMATFAMALLYVIASDNTMTFGDAFLMSYRLDYADFQIRVFDPLSFVVFIVGSLLCPLIMLNLLIAIMSDTYDRVQESMTVADSKEIAEMLLEIEQVMWWKRQNNKKYYLHACIDYGHANSESFIGWEGRLRAVKSCLYGIDDRLKEDKVNFERRFRKFEKAMKHSRKLLNVCEKNIKSSLTYLSDEAGILTAYVEQLQAGGS